MAWSQVLDLTGTDGEDGISVVDAEINGSGDLVLTLSDSSTINAGRAKGEPGGGIDFESSVATVEDLPGTAPYGEARFVQADGHLYVFEENGGGEGVDGWTDVGPIRGETGSTGADGADGDDGVSVTGASIDGSGHLILTLSSGGPIDAGVAKGAKGDTGDQGEQGEQGETGDQGPRGTGVFGGSGSPSTEVGYIVGDYWIDESTGALWKLS